MYKEYSRKSFKPNESSSFLDKAMLSSHISPNQTVAEADTHLIRYPVLADPLAFGSLIDTRYQMPAAKIFCQSQVEDPLMLRQLGRL